MCFAKCVTNNVTARNAYEFKSDLSHVKSSEHSVKVESSVCHVMHVLLRCPVSWAGVC